MGQADVLRWLEENPGWHSPADIAASLERDTSNVRRLLMKLLRNQDVERKVENGKKARLYRAYIRRM